MKWIADWVRVIATIALIAIWAVWHVLFKVFEAITEGCAYTATACLYTAAIMAGIPDDQIKIYRGRHESR